MKHPIATLTRANAPAGKKGGGSEVSWTPLVALSNLDGFTLASGGVGAFS
jgi:hypothetical protein